MPPIPLYPRLEKRDLEQYLGWPKDLTGFSFRFSSFSSSSSSSVLPSFESFSLEHSLQARQGNLGAIYQGEGEVQFVLD